VVLLRALVASEGGLIDIPSVVGRMGELVPSGPYRFGPYIHLLLSLDACPGTRLLPPRLLIDEAVDVSRVEAALHALEVALQGTPGVLLESLIAAAENVLEAEDDNRLESQVKCLANQVGKEVLPGLYSSRSWRREDYAQFVLEQHGSPLHFTELAHRVSCLAGKNLHPAGFDTMLNGSQLFVRVGAGDFALAKWGARRYGRFDEVIQRYLASGRIAEHIETIKGALLRHYTVAETTVQAMLASARNTFRYYGGGYWGLVGYTPLIEPVLVERVVTVLTESSEALSAPDIERRVAEQLGPRGFSAGEVRRAIYVSPRFRCIGGPARRRFLLAAAAR
jgi:hypothetical protein